MRGSFWLAAAVIAISGCAAPDDEGTAARETAGVVVEAVSRGGSGEKAGLAAGDILLTWSRPRTATASGRSGRLRTPFDLARLEREEAPLGTIRLEGTRRGAPITVEPPPGNWSLRARPVLSEELSRLYDDGLEQLRAGQVEQALALWRDISGQLRDQGEIIPAAWMLWRIGQELKDRRDWPGADAAYEQSFEALTAAGSTFEAGLVREAQALAFRARGDLEKSRAAWQEAANLYRKMGDRGLAEAHALQRLAEIQFQNGDLDAAEASAVHSLRLRRKLAPGSIWVGRSIGLLGTFATERGDLVEAQRRFEEALAIEQALSPDSISTGVYLGSLGAIAYRRGRFSEARGYAHRNLQIARKLDPGGLREAAALNNLAAAEMILGDLEAAEAALRAALAIKRARAPASAELALSMTNLGELQIERGDLDAAGKTLQESLDLKLRRAPEGPSLALTLASLGDLESRRGNRSRAIERYRRAIDILRRRAPGGLDLARTLSRLAPLAAETGDRAEAERLTLEGLAIRERLAPESADVAESYRDLGRLRRSQDRLEQAADAYRNALGALEAQRGDLGPSDVAGSSFSKRYADVYREAIDLLAELGHEGEAFDVLERSRARSFLMLLAARDLKLNRTAPADVEERRRRLRLDRERTFSALARVDPADEPAVKALRTRLAEIRSLQAQVEEEVRSTDSRSGDLRFPRVLDHQEALRSLDPGTILMAFSVGERRTLAFVAGAGRPLVLRPLAIGAADLEELVDRLRESVGEARPGATGERRRQAFEAIAAELHDRLIRPLADLLKGGDRLLVIADGPLHLLPFAALRPAGGGVETYLGRRWPIHAISSLTVYSQLHRHLAPARTEPAVEVFGDPDNRRAPQSTQAWPVAAPWIRRRGGAWLGPLPGSRDEARRIAALFPRSRLWLGREATEERAKAIGTGIGYLHFACHAILDERFPLESALVLSLPGEVSEGGENGLLQAWEILEQVRLEANLVVLSACSSAGREMGGEGLVGLTRAFQYAGARSVVASLWPITDGATSVFMGRFYEHLRKGLSKDRALQAAQNEAADGRMAGATGRDLSSPFYWSAFQLIGDYR